MRRTEVYGFTDNAVYFEWPMPNDMLQMKKNTPINIQDLKYKICSQNMNVFGAFKVVLSN